MRDPLSWSIPLGRLFGVTVRVHLLFPIFVLGIIGLAATEKGAPAGLWVEACILMGLLFLAVFLHELGHVFGARSVDGDANEVMLWPLGGLIAPEVPSTPRAHLIAAAAGPLVNLALGLGVCLALLSAGLVPSFRPWADPYRPVLYSYSDGSFVGSKTGQDLYRFTGYKVNDHWVSAADVTVDSSGTPRDAKGQVCTAVRLHPDDVARLNPQEGSNQPTFVLTERDDKGIEKKVDRKNAIHVQPEELANGKWVVLASQIFWVNWVLLLLNLVPAFPLDGARLLQAALWWRSDYRQGTLAAIFAGFVVMFLCVLLAIIVYDPLVLLLAIIIYLFCKRQWIVLETGGEESLFGYDFSQGYTSLEREAGPPPAPPRRRQGWLQRWLQQRRAERMRREQEEREAEERRMDELLEKVQCVGLQGLTEEERRFMTRVSARYRNRQE